MVAVAHMIDHYTLKARVMPALFSVLPLLLILGIWWSLTLKAWGLVLAFVSATGIVGLLSNGISNLGNKLQVRLFRSWGGLPTVTLLRHGDQTLDRYTKARYHATLNEVVPGLELPSAHEEEGDPKDADAKYYSATQFLLEVTRDKNQFPLVYSDNVAYGYARNLLALRWVGMGSAAFAVVASLFKLRVAFASAPSVQAALQAHSVQLFCGALVISIGMLVVFGMIVTSEHVRKRAVRYARSLLASCEKIGGKSEV